MILTNTRASIAVPLSVGIAGGLVAALAGHMSTKYIISIVAAVVFAVGFLLMRRPERWEYLLLALFSFSILFKLDVNLLHRSHVGGAGGIQITLSFLVAIALLMLNAGRGYVFRESIALGRSRFVLLFPALYGVAGVLSLLNADDASLVLFQCVAIFSLMTICLSFLYLRGDRAIQFYVFALSLGLFIEAGLAVLQYKFNLPFHLKGFGEEELVKLSLGVNSTVSRATGTIGHPNILGYYFEVLIPLVFALFLTESRRLFKILYAVVFVSGLIGIVTTFSRGAWLTLPISLSIVFIASFWGRFTRLKSAIGITLIALFGVVLVLIVYPTIEKRILHKDHGSAASRMPLNVGAFSIVKQHPLVGIGLNNFSEVFKKYDTTGKSNIFKGYRQVVHNMYLLVWAEVGTIGLLAFLGILIYPSWLALCHVSRVGLRDRGILIGVAAGVGAILVHGLVDSGFQTQYNISALLFSLIGLVGAVVEKSRIPSREPETEFKKW